MTGEPRLPKTVALARDAAKRLGWEFRILDREYGHLFEVDNGARRRVLIGALSPLNDSVASRLAADKYFTAQLLERAGLRVPDTERCLAPGFFDKEIYEEKAGPGPGIEFARRHGYPVVVKPNRGSSGRNVVLAGNDDELRAALEPAWERHGLAVVQRPIPAPDLRLDFLDGDYLLGYERAPIRVTGDGSSTLRDLVAGVDRRFENDAAWGGKRRDSWPDDAGRTPDSILPAGDSLDLGGLLLNLNTWASARLIPELPPRWLDYGLRAGAVLGLRHFGIDFRAPASTTRRSRRRSSRSTRRPCCCRSMRSAGPTRLSTPRPASSARRSSRGPGASSRGHRFFFEERRIFPPSPRLLRARRS